MWTLGASDPELFTEHGMRIEIDNDGRKRMKPRWLVEASKWTGWIVLVLEQLNHMF